MSRRVASFCAYRHMGREAVAFIGSLDGPGWREPVWVS